MPVKDAGRLAIDPCIRPASASAGQAGWKKGGEAELNQQRRVKAGRAGDEDGSGERSSKTGHVTRASLRQFQTNRAGCRLHCTLLTGNLRRPVDT